MKSHHCLPYLLVILATFDLALSQFTESPSDCQRFLERDDVVQLLIQKDPSLAPAVVESVAGCYVVRRI